jgi:hypothetical protein
MFLVGLLMNIGRRPVFAPRIARADTSRAAVRRRQRVRVAVA